MAAMVAKAAGRDETAAGRLSSEVEEGIFRAAPPRHTCPQRPKPESKPMPKLTATDTTAAVDRFMAALQHPHKGEIEQLRHALLAVDAAVAEGIKWNAPSWRTTEYFATTHLRDKTGFSLVLHLGAKARALPEGGLGIDDPQGLLAWRGRDRALVSFASAAEFSARLPALQAVVKQWIRWV